MMAAASFWPSSSQTISFLPRTGLPLAIASASDMLAGSFFAVIRVIMPVR